MVLKKPYAFFIKFFKPIHLIITFLIGYLISLDSSILSFLSSYISTYSGLMNTMPTSGLYSPLLTIIPIVICIMSLLVLGVMVRKRKPILFYVVNILLYIAVIIVNIYAINFLKTINEAAVSIRITKLVHDFVFLAMGVEIATFILFLSRGLGLNIKKFDFDSDLLNMDISESDMEEFEVNLNLNIDETRRKRKRSFRMLEYKYAENKTLVNSIIGGSLGFIVDVILVVVLLNVNRNVQGKTYSIAGININVKNTYVLNTDYLGNRITDNYLVVVSASLGSNFLKNVYLKDFNLRIGDALLKPTTAYNKYLDDIGFSDSELAVSPESKNYIFVYEIPKKVKNKKLMFRYTNMGKKLEINLAPKHAFEGTNKTVNIGEELSIGSELGSIKFKIDDFDLQQKYSFKYSYCVKNDDCVNSVEYLKPSLNENFDKSILRLKVEYKNESNINTDSFYDFFNKFGMVYYNIDGEWKTQKSRFEKLSPLKIVSPDNVYIGVNSEILKADQIRLIFNIRGSKYEYLLK